MQNYITEQVQTCRQELRRLAHRRINEEFFDQFYVQVRRLDKVNLLAKHLKLSFDPGVREELVPLLERIGGLKYRTHLLKVWAESDVFDLLTSITLQELGLVAYLEEISRYVVHHVPLSDRLQVLLFSLLGREKERFLQVYRLMEEQESEDLIEDFQLFHAVITGDELRLRKLLNELDSRSEDLYENTYRPVIEQRSQEDFKGMLSFYLASAVPYALYLYPLLFEREVRR